MVLPTGSSDTTIIVSVRVAVASGSASTPRSRMLTRSSSVGSMRSGALVRPATAPLEDPGERVPEGRPVAVDDDVGQEDRRRR